MCGLLPGGWRRDGWRFKGGSQTFAGFSDSSTARADTGTLSDSYLSIAKSFDASRSKEVGIGLPRETPAARTMSTRKRALALKILTLRDCTSDAYVLCVCLFVSVHVCVRAPARLCVLAPLCLRQ